eukprot:5407006-Pyramimonas_sp.AAC.1
MSVPITSLHWYVTGALEGSAILGLSSATQHGHASCWAASVNDCRALPYYRAMTKFLLLQCPMFSW